MCSRQDAKNAKESISLVLKAIDGSDDPVLHQRLAKIQQVPRRLSARRR
jgi:hypothetical protein